MIVGESSTVKIGLGLMAYNQMLSSTVYSTVHPMTVMGARSCFLLRSPEDSIVPKPKQTVVPSLFTAYRLEIKRNGKGIKEKLRYVDPTITHLAYGLLDYSAEEFKHAVTIENQLNQKVKIIRSDNGTEFKNRVMLEFCREKGIKQEFSNARTPQQNGVAERMMDPYRGKMTLRAKETCMIWLGHIVGLEGDEEGLVDVLVKLETSFDEVFTPFDAAASTRRNKKIMYNFKLYKVKIFKERCL
ncbi:putative ribonuclease H-like domain-containing protein [Tanacetum coccineum]